MPTWTVLLTYAAVIAAAAALVILFRNVPAYWHVWSILVACAIAITPISMLPFGGVSDLLVGSVIALLTLWGAGGIIAGAVTRAGLIRRPSATGSHGERGA